jgi:hypothetical protein
MVINKYCDVLEGSSEDDFLLGGRVLTVWTGMLFDKAKESGFE